MSTHHSLPPVSPGNPQKQEEPRDDSTLDVLLRPRSWEEYIGQDRLKQNLRILIDAARKRGETPEHILLSGPAGLGKTSMAHVIAREMQAEIRITSGPAIERVGDLASILTNLLPGDILFIDEVHRINKTVEETLYPAMESRKLDIIIGKGPSARIIQLDLPQFTLIAATPRAGLLSSPLRSRFSGGAFRLDFYSLPDMQRILRRSASILGVTLETPALERIARVSRFTPRVANRLLKRTRDYAEVHGQGVITDAMACLAFELLSIDDMGLDAMDRRILETIIKKFGGGPVGLHAIGAASSEEEDTIEEVYEPYLMQLGFLERTPRGRVATELAYQHLGIASAKQKPLLS